MKIKTGNTYNYFDDGKIRESRKDVVLITDIIPFKDVDKDILILWKQELEHCHWLFAKETDFFVRGRLLNANEEVIFVRTLNGGWFSMGWFGGRLDVDGSLTKLLTNR